MSAAMGRIIAILAALVLAAGPASGSGNVSDGAGPGRGEVRLPVARPGLAVVPSDRTEGSRLERFLASRNNLIVQDRHPVGELAGSGMTIRFEAVTAYVPGSARLKGLLVQVRIEQLKETGQSCLDLDEALTLIRAIDDLPGLAARWQAEDRENAEAAIVTRDNLKLGLIKTRFGFFPFLSCGRGKELKCSFSSVDDFLPLRDLLQKGVSILEEQ